MIQGYLEKEIQTPMAQGRSSQIISTIEWIRTSRLSIKNSLSLPHSLLRGLREAIPAAPRRQHWPFYQAQWQRKISFQVILHSNATNSHINHGRDRRPTIQEQARVRVGNLLQACQYQPSALSQVSLPLSLSPSLSLSFSLAVGGTRCIAILEVARTQRHTPSCPNPAPHTLNLIAASINDKYSVRPFSYQFVPDIVAQ